MDLLIGLVMGVGVNYLHSDAQKGGAVANFLNQDDDGFIEIEVPPLPPPTRRPNTPTNPQYIEPPAEGLPRPALYRFNTDETQILDGERGWRNADDVKREHNIKKCSNRCKRCESGRKITKMAKKKLNRKRKKEVKEMICAFKKKRKGKGDSKLPPPVTRRVFNFMKSIIKF